MEEILAGLLWNARFDCMDPNINCADAVTVVFLEETISQLVLMFIV